MWIFPLKIMKKGSKAAKAWGAKMRRLRESPKKKGGTKKGQKRKTARRAYKGLTKRVRRKSNKPKTTRKSVAKKSLKSKIFGGTLGKVALGVGAGSIAGYAANMVAPQFAQFARPVAAYIAAGPIGLIADLALNQGLLQQITGMFGFGNSGGMVAQQEVGGL